MIDGGLRKLFHAHLPQIHFTSIETGSTGRGIPDDNYCDDGHEGWIEYKTTENYTVGLRPEQVGWLLRRTRAGGRTFVAVRRRHGGGRRRGARVDELWLYNGAGARVLAELGMKACRGAALGIWESGPARWDWEKVGWWLGQ